MDIGRVIKKLRRTKNISQKKLSNLTGLSQSFISKIERGLEAPSSYTLYKISEALETSLVFDFVNANDTKHSKKDKESKVIESANNVLDELLISSGVTTNLELEQVENINYFVPKVFIPYSHEDNHHKLWVKKLSDKLFDNGVDVIVDIYDTRAGSNIIAWMNESIKKAKYVLPIYTPEYCKKAIAGIGGVGYEHTIITQELFDTINSNEKIIPIIRKGDIQTSIPPFIRPLLNIDFRNDEDFDVKSMELLRILHNEPKFKKPKIGKNPFIKKL